MDITRIQEIIASKDTYEVTFNGKSVWLTYVHPGFNEVDVRVLGSDEKMRINADDLNEGKKL